MRQRLRIYIAGPYSADEEATRKENVLAAIDAAIALVFKGHVPYVPHLTHFVDERARQIGVELSWDDYIRWDLEWLRLCDAVLYLGSSKGADLELQAALAWEKTVFYSLDEVGLAQVTSLKGEAVQR